MIDIEAARALLDFGRRMGAGPRADEQLEGAVSIHNILRKHRVAYLADEVGMGKTYVALGALALFRHFQPNFRVLVIAPRYNIQQKWQKELSNFAAHNVRFPDLRVAAIDRQPARAMVDCGNLVHFVREVAIDPHRDFFLRMSSFSLALGKDPASWRRFRAAIKNELPWVPDEAFDLRSKDRFKDNFATAVCCAIPKFDLIIVDEAHNLKHGYSPSSAARNRVLARVFGRADGDSIDPDAFRGYGPRAERVLFLSATPIEETYRHLWNQLDIFGFGATFEELCRDDLTENTKKDIARQFLVRRVTEMSIAGRAYTKNQYRREWRRGGVETHDHAIEVNDPRQRLVVALVQKKVAELLGSARFNRSFQVGMLASFESFLETAGLKREDDERNGVFDDSEQADDPMEREGLDVHAVNRLARDYRRRFGTELPHPKMDAVVESLSSTWVTGRKALIFVRRVASVTELERKLDERYDAWLIPHLRARLGAELQGDFDRVVRQYEQEKAQLERRRRDRQAAQHLDADGDDRGGSDTFFAWYFRGDGPKGVVSGANIQARFTKTSGALARFFAENHVAALLDVQPEESLAALASVLGASPEQTRDRIRRSAAPYISKAKQSTSAMRFDAAQAAALELLADRAGGDIGERARIVWEESYASSKLREHAAEAPDVSGWLAHRTFFTELRAPQWASLRAAIFPASKRAPRCLDEWRDDFRERELRAQLLATAARLGHPLIDLYVVVMSRRASLALGSADHDEGEAVDVHLRRIREYLELLDEQRRIPLGPERPWGAFDELSAIASNFELILDVNAPDARNAPLSESGRRAGQLLGRQRPVGGMSGQVNATLVQQFRMPGYPFVLVTTDLLQEGEDLHTFCSTIHHYGISWTPSAMEQRTGRIDRVRSQTDRRLSALDHAPDGDALLQVHFPYLNDTVEVLQVERVLERMNTFLRLMHEGLTVPKTEQRKIDVAREMVATRRDVESIREPLRSAFPVQPDTTHGPVKQLATGERSIAAIVDRFTALTQTDALGVPVDWAPSAQRGALLGAARLPSGRQQPFTLLLRSESGRPVVRCISPVGRVEPESSRDAIMARARGVPCRVGAILTKEDRTYDLTLEEDVTLAAPEHDGARVGLLLARVLEQADHFERVHFDDERDAPLHEFERELTQERRHD